MTYEDKNKLEECDTCSGEDSEHIEYGRKFKTKKFKGADAANAFMEKNKGWGALAHDHKTDIVHVARMSDKGEKVNESFGKDEDLAEKTRTFKNADGSKLTIEPHGDKFTLTHESKSGKKWQESHSRPQTNAMLDQFMNKGLKENMEKTIVENIADKNFVDAKPEILNKLYKKSGELLANLMPEIAATSFKEESLDESDNPYISKEWKGGKLHKKIDIWHNGKYVASSNAYKTVKNARMGYAHVNKLDPKEVKASYAPVKEEVVTEELKVGDKVIVRPPSYPNMKWHGVIKRASKYGKDFHRVEYEYDGMGGGKSKSIETFHAKHLTKVNEAEQLDEDIMKRRASENKAIEAGKPHGEKGHFNIYVKDHDSHVTGYGKHDRVMATEPDHEGLYMRVDHKHKLGMPSHEQMLKVAGKSAKHWTHHKSEKWDDGSATDVYFKRKK